MYIVAQHIHDLYLFINIWMYAFIHVSVYTIQFFIAKHLYELLHLFNLYNFTFSDASHSNGISLYTLQHKSMPYHYITLNDTSSHSITFNSMPLQPTPLQFHSRSFKFIKSSHCITCCNTLNQHVLCNPTQCSFTTLHIQYIHVLGCSCAHAVFQIILHLNIVISKSIHPVNSKSIQSIECSLNLKHIPTQVNTT